MNAPVLAAFAPGVLVVGRIVSAISSRYAISSGVNGVKGTLPRSGRQPLINGPLPIIATPPRMVATRSTASRLEISSGLRSLGKLSFEVIDFLRSDVAAI